MRFKRHVPDDRVSDGDTRQLFMIYAVLARAKGQAVTADDVHDAMTLRESDHGSLVEYERLDEPTKMKTTSSCARSAR